MRVTERVIDVGRVSEEFALEWRFGLLDNTLSETLLTGEAIFRVLKMTDI